MANKWTVLTDSSNLILCILADGLHLVNVSGDSPKVQNAVVYLTVQIWIQNSRTSEQPTLFYTFRNIDSPIHDSEFTHGTHNEAPIQLGFSKKAWGTVSGARDRKK
jgi:hypothetical protein